MDDSSRRPSSEKGEEYEHETYTPTATEIEAQREWYLVDAGGQTLGRVATLVAQLLRGKNKPTFATHIDTGDYVVVVNADKVVVKKRARS